jgi:hypothetical protein
MAEPGRLRGPAAPAMAPQVADGAPAAARREVTAFGENDQRVAAT